MENRLKEIRMYYGLNQEQFGKRIGLTRSAICNYESGSRLLSEQTIISVCREFNVNEEWLRNGEGEPYINPLPEIEIAQYAAELCGDNGNKLIKSVLLSYGRLNSKNRKVIDQFTDNIIELLKEAKE
ncbi:helix-turn-helix transcriptional regulator [Diplocloster modestus]|uniref:Helix-turn-helix domain-containing protein n=1 Tax=Diplocloster modestus TaxID=2850322 RepID=A0ABS6KCR1_9FIRM|nr:helix-turn-helix transcriptional regulator [Diplocloster modestus]MBU9728300.1 helix-turn-helix domain-containing protein [Diplocloster modestus]